jgi:hypothetical protein
MNDICQGTMIVSVLPLYVTLMQPPQWAELSQICSETQAEPSMFDGRV